VSVKGVRVQLEESSTSRANPDVRDALATTVDPGQTRSSTITLAVVPAIGTVTADARRTGAGLPGRPGEELLRRRIRVPDAPQFTGALERKLGCRVPAVDVFANPTLDRLARHRAGSRLD
jgi:hypothetical protein